MRGRKEEYSWMNDWVSRWIFVGFVVYVTGKIGRGQSIHRFEVQTEKIEPELAGISESLCINVFQF